MTERKVDSQDDMESISSEDSDLGRELRTRQRLTYQEIWDRNQVHESLKSLPGGEELLENLTEDHTHSHTTGLLIAAWQGYSDILDKLLKQTTVVDVRDTEGRTPLHLACCIGSAACVEILLRNGAKAQVWNVDHTVTPLHCAASVGSLPCVKLLLQYGVDVNAGLTGRSALHYAVQSNAVDCVKELLNSGACPNTPQVYTETPLHVAAAMGSAECVKLLLEHGADVRVQFGVNKTTVLHLAAEDGNAECTRLLVEAGANVNAKNIHLQTPLHIAALAQSAEILEVLLEKGADPNVQDSEGRTPLHSAIVKVCRSSECVRLLLDCNANVNKADKYGYTPLHVAALNELSSCVLLLLSYGADMTARTKGNVSALSFILRRTPVVLPRILGKLDHAIKLHDHEIGDIDCELKLDFKILVPNVEKGETDLLLTFIEVGQRHVLKHPLCETFLFLKWRRIRKFFLLSLLFHTFFALLFSFYVWQIFSKVCDSKDSNCKITMALKIIGYILLVFNLIFLAKEVFQIAHSGTNYICHWENWLQWLIIITVPLCILHAEPTGNNTEQLSEWQHHDAAVAIFLAWVEMMMLVGRFPSFGLYIQMFTTVAYNFFKFLLAYCCLFIAFSFGFAVLFPDYPAFKNILLSFMKTMVMMSGEQEFENIFYKKDPKYPVTAHLLFMTFVILVTVILTNLLVGLAVSDIQGLQQSAGLNRLVRQAQLVAHMESMLFSKLLHCMPKKLLTLCHRSALLLMSPYQSSLYIRPNDPREKRIPKELINNAYRLVAERKEKTKKNRHENSSIFSRPLDEKDYSYVRLTHPNVSDTDYNYVKFTNVNIGNEGEYYQTPQSNCYGMTVTEETGLSNKIMEETLNQVLTKLNTLMHEIKTKDAVTQQKIEQLSEQTKGLRERHQSERLMYNT